MNARMWYIEVLVADAAYHKDEPLTYASTVRLSVGKIVLVPLRSKQVFAIVVGVVAKPTFPAKQIIGIPDLPKLPDAHLQLLAWLREYYPAPLGTIVQLFLPGSFAAAKVSPPAKKMPQTTDSQLPPLTEDQQAALKQIQAKGLHILHGETGSGKTRVYVELAQGQLALGKSAIILTPEIGLTSQLLDAFQHVFGDRVVLLHSGLSETKRREAWLRALTSQESLIVVGTRSALFAPVHNLGLIVIDEAHETAYKQDQTPYYQTSTVAAKLAEICNAALVLGSATPLVRDYYIASQKNRPVVRMTRAAASGISHDHQALVVDLKDRGQFRKSPYLSTPLIAAVEARLKQGEQSLLFLNRRGTARVVFCQRCGWRAACPNCDLPLVYHGDNHTMRCHSCSHRANAPASCPACQGSDVVFKSIGTKAIADEAQRLFPGARIMRFDTDNKKSERLDAHYTEIRDGQIDIIVGTQTLAKGLDLPKLSLVGVIIADTGLYFPDFSAQERTYQLLGQVLGRVGRGHRKGMAIIQTYTPESPLLQAVITKDWGQFYNNEIKERQQFLFPPFCYLLKLSCKRASDSAAQKTAEQLASSIRTHYRNVIVDGPAPSFHGKVQNKFVWQIIVKSKQRKHLVAIIKSLPSGWSYDIDPMNLL